MFLWETHFTDKEPHRLKRKECKANRHARAAAVAMAVAGRMQFKSKFKIKKGLYNGNRNNSTIRNNNCKYKLTQPHHWKNKANMILFKGKDRHQYIWRFQHPTFIIGQAFHIKIQQGHMGLKPHWRANGHKQTFTQSQGTHSSH